MRSPPRKVDRLRRDGPYTDTVLGGPQYDGTCWFQAVMNLNLHIMPRLFPHAPDVRAFKRAIADAGNFGDGDRVNFQTAHGSRLVEIATRFAYDNAFIKKADVSELAAKTIASIMTHESRDVAYERVRPMWSKTLKFVDQANHEEAFKRVWKYVRDYLRPHHDKFTTPIMISSKQYFRFCLALIIGARSYPFEFALRDALGTERVSYAKERIGGALTKDRGLFDRLENACDFDGKSHGQVRRFYTEAHFFIAKMQEFEYDFNMLTRIALKDYGVKVSVDVLRRVIRRRIQKYWMVVDSTYMFTTTHDGETILYSSPPDEFKLVELARQRVRDVGQLRQLILHHFPDKFAGYLDIEAHTLVIYRDGDALNVYNYGEDTDIRRSKYDLGHIKTWECYVRRHHGGRRLTF